ncbi:MAG: DUF2764 family protein [Bacteroidales bacterium]|nr:DUF2764 family protein [Bacteroidales bacterium]
MFKNQYYYFVAGLPDFSFDSTKLPFTVLEFKEMLYDELKQDDKKLIDKYFLEVDKDNLLKLLLDKEAKIKETGVYSREEMLGTIKSIKESEDVKKENIVPVFETFIRQWLKEDAESESKNWENILTSLYMDYGVSVKNSLVSQWFTLNLNIGNVLAAIYSRKYGMDVKQVVVGNNHIAKTIRANSGSRDFGLEQELDYFDAMLKISEETDIYERERKIDKFRWDWLEENTVFDYFNIEYLFAYLCKLQILERWVQLNAEEGERVFRELIANMKKDVIVPNEEQ